MDQKLKKEKTERAKSRITRERVKKKKKKAESDNSPETLYRGEDIRHPRTPFEAN